MGAGLSRSISSYFGSRSKKSDSLSVDSPMILPPLVINCNPFELPFLVEKMRKNRNISSAIVDVDINIRADSYKNVSKTRKSALAKLEASKKAYEKAVAAYKEKAQAVAVDKSQLREATSVLQMIHTQITSDRQRLSVDLSTPSSESDGPPMASPINLAQSQYTIKLGSSLETAFPRFVKHNEDDWSNVEKMMRSFHNSSKMQVKNKEIAEVKTHITNVTHTATKIPMIQTILHELPDENSYAYAMANSVTSVSDITAKTNHSQFDSLKSTSPLGSPPCIPLPPILQMHDLLEVDKRKLFARQRLSNNSKNHSLLCQQSLLPPIDEDLEENVSIDIIRMLSTKERLQNKMMLPNIDVNKKKPALASTVESVYNFYAHMFEDELSTKEDNVDSSGSSVISLPESYQESTSSIPTLISEASSSESFVDQNLCCVNIF
ncbi:hypothetical protein L204_100581 [Cryptococcus depauperatus]